MMRVADLVIEAHAYAVSKGFWNELREFGTLIALVHSELSEALEAHRRGEGLDRIGEELADAVLRIADICGAYRINLEECLKVKMIKNLARRPMHGKLY
jgi:NTP pyrophosphatase (non-canonical NTP hydrolase)